MLVVALLSEHSHSLSLIYCCCMSCMIHRNIHIAHSSTYLLCSVYLSSIIIVYNAVAALLCLTCYAITSMSLSIYARHPIFIIHDVEMVVQHPRLSILLSMSVDDVCPSSRCANLTSVCCLFVCCG